ncbi:MAG: methyltransferase domain-containing protein [Planctomycetota bacterium]
MPDYTRRSDESELMDDLAIGGDELRQTLDQLATINRLLGGYAPSISGVQRLLPAGCTAFSLLDVGCGSGDTCRQIDRWATRRGIAVSQRGIDLHPDTIDHARESTDSSGRITFDVQDLFALPDEPIADVVHAALVLHHFPGDSARKAVEKMARLARVGVVINDLHRHWFAYHSIRWLTRLLSRNRLIRHDAAVSVLRGFRRHEMIELATVPGFAPPAVRWRWAFRWEVVIRRAGIC